MDPVTGQPSPTDPNPQPVAASAPVPAPPPAPTVDPETLTANITQAVTENVTASLNHSVGQALAAQKQTIVRAITGEPASNEERTAEFFDKFAKNPVDVLAAVAFQAKEAAKQELRSEDDQAEAKLREQRIAATEVFADRPDIKASPEAREALDAYYERTDPNLPEKERMTQALHKYDKWAESQGLGGKEDRIAKVASPRPNASAGNANPEPQKKTSEQFQQEEQRERVEAYKRKHGGRYVAAA